ncbi:MAG: dihydrodipicolinate synthase family protein [Anaerolineales bacterium]|nr:dihydrodipicolinate synthase family protein [Anaerolineales bacterium]
MKDFGPIVPIVTPCNRSGEPDLNGLQAVCKEMLAASYKGIFVAGSTGRGPWFGRSDREKICRAAAAYVNGVVPLIAGVTGSGLPDMLENARMMADSGAQIAVATVPGYYKYNPQEIEIIYLRFADASPLPVMVYDIPEFTNTKLDQDMILRLAMHGNIIAFKDSSTDFDRFRELLAALEQQPDFLLFQGKENLIFDSLRLGASGFIVSLIHLAPATFIKLYQAARAGDFAAGNLIQKEVAEILVLVRDSIEKRPESSTLFHMLNVAMRQRGVCENLLLEHDREPPPWLIQNAQKAVEICLGAGVIPNQQ